MYIVALVYLTRVLLLCLFINFTEIFGDGFLPSQVTYWIFCTVDKRQRNHVYLRHILNMYDLYFATLETINAQSNYQSGIWNNVGYLCI